MVRPRLATALTPLMLVGLFAATTSAQIVRGSISGTIRDTQGGVIQNATVTVTNTDTRAARTTTTDDQGFFSIAALDPGVYDVTAETKGFTKVENRSVNVRTATNTSLDFELRPGAVDTVVQVQAEFTELPLNRTSPTIGTTLGQRAVVELPLPAGRNINNLVLTAPNASFTTGQGTYAINGQRPRNNNYMIDGSDNNDINVTIATSQIVPEAVAEFQILQNPYSVEFGRNSGGQINVITRSGANRFHGDAWEYFTSSDFYSLDNLEKAQDRTKPPRFKRHQVGGALGGPIIRDRLFFFGLYQYDPQRPGPGPGPTTRIPTPAGYAGLQGVPLGSGQSPGSRQAVLQRIGFLQDVYAQNPVFRNLSTTTVNGVPIETGQTNIDIVDPSTYHTVLLRGDYELSGSDRVTVRYSLNDRTDENAISNLRFGSLFAGNQALKDTNFAASNTHVFSPALLNEARFSLVRRDLSFPENDPNSPTADILGLFQIGGDANFPQSRITNSWQYSNTATWVVPRHSIKFGADIRYNTADNESAFNLKGTFTFNNLQDYMNNSAFRLQQQLQTAGFYATQWQSFLFVQDDFQLRDDLTLNLGLRYEVATNPLGWLGNTDPESLAVLVPGPPKKDTNNWAPRVGFAWSPRSNSPFLGDGRTVIRGGFGIGYDVVFYNLLTTAASNYPRVITADLNNIVDVYPGLLQVTAQPVFDPLNGSYTNVTPDLENPESRFYSLSWQREIRNTYLVEVGYSGSRSYKGINQVQLNPAILTPEQAATVRAGGTIPSAQSRRLFPQYGTRTLIPGYVGPNGNDMEARAEYNAVFFSAGRRFSRGLQFHTSYTYSRWYSNNDESLAAGGTDGSNQRPQSMFNIEPEWSRSNFDRPHRFVVSYVWEVPGPSSGWRRQVAGGWQFSGVTGGQSGRPFTIVTGVDSNGDLNTGSDRPNIDPSGTFVWDDDHKNFVNNGYYVTPLGSNGLPLINTQAGDGGNAPRNSERFKHFWVTDVSLIKRVYFGPQQVILRADAFNVFNQDNYGGARNTTIGTAPNFNSLNSASFGQNGLNFGRRSFQFSAKVTF
jgi:hypothetical protein